MIINNFKINNALLNMPKRLYQTIWFFYLFNAGFRIKWLANFGKNKKYFFQSNNNVVRLLTFALMNLSGLRLSQHTWGVFSFIEGGKNAV